MGCLLQEGKEGPATPESLEFLVVQFLGLIPDDPETSLGSFPKILPRSFAEKLGIDTFGEFMDDPGLFARGISSDYIQGS